MPPIVLELHKNMTLHVPLQTNQILCSQECSVQFDRFVNKTTENATVEVSREYLEKFLSEDNLTETEKRYVKTQLAFEDLDLRILDESPFVLVSFGSVAQVGYFKNIQLCIN